MLNGPFRTNAPSIAEPDGNSSLISRARVRARARKGVSVPFVIAGLKADEIVFAKQRNETLVVGQSSQHFRRWA
jgi:hypothetical protein